MRGHCSSISRLFLPRLGACTLHPTHTFSVLFSDLNSVPSAVDSLGSMRNSGRAIDVCWLKSGLDRQAMRVEISRQKTLRGGTEEGRGSQRKIEHRIRSKPPTHSRFSLCGPPWVSAPPRWAFSRGIRRDGPILHASPQIHEPGKRASTENAESTKRDHKLAGWDSLLIGIRFSPRATAPEAVCDRSSAPRVPHR